MPAAKTWHLNHLKPFVCLHWTTTTVCSQTVTKPLWTYFEAATRSWSHLLWESKSSMSREKQTPKPWHKQDQCDNREQGKKEQGKKKQLNVQGPTVKFLHVLHNNHPFLLPHQYKINSRLEVFTSRNYLLQLPPPRNCREILNPTPCKDSCHKVITWHVDVSHDNIVLLKCRHLVIRIFHPGHKKFKPIRYSKFIQRGLNFWVSMSSHRLKPRNCSGTTFQGAMMTHLNCFLSAKYGPETTSQSTVIVHYLFWYVISWSVPVQFTVTNASTVKKGSAMVE